MALNSCYMPIYGKEIVYLIQQITTNQKLGCY